jgi:hypothetical protein
MTARNHYYAFEIMDAFWCHLVEHAETGRVVSIDRVKDELRGQLRDGLYEWACNKCPKAFVGTDRPDVIHHYGKIIQWVHDWKYTDGAKKQFPRGADGWLIAYAKAAGHTVVTLESSEPQRLGKVKIPDVCKQFDIKCIDPFKMLKAIGKKIG